MRRSAERNAPHIDEVWPLGEGLHFEASEVSGVGATRGVDEVAASFAVVQHDPHRTGPGRVETAK